MTRYGNYELDSKLYQSSNSTIWRGHNTQTKDQVIIKLITNEDPDRIEVARLEHEYKLLMRLHARGLSHPLELLQVGRRYALVMEDGTSQALSTLLKGKPLGVKEFLLLAIDIVNSMSGLHNLGIVHKDIKPGNILKDKDNKIKFIDLGIASEISREYQEVQDPGILEGTLSYIAPEQTGRMNRAIDYRCDYYSLGVTFYEILTGQLPFVAEDDAEMIYCHLARSPKSPQQINEQIPQMVSDVVMKLMKKNSEERYQSAAALLVDLQYCLDQLTQRGFIEPKPLAENDIPNTFGVSQVLYGREKEIATIYAAFDKVAKGGMGMLLVSGLAGVGKTSVINEVNRPLTERRAFFMKGKFEHLKQNVAYSALGEAIRQYAHQLLKLPDREFKEWREKFLETLSPNAQLIIDLAPEMEVVLGKQEPVIELTPEQAQDRYHYTIRNFIQLIAKEEHPLVLFLDDLQWADFASIKLIRKIMTSEPVPYLFVVGSYRENEVNRGHPLLDIIEKGEKDKRLQEIFLEPLSEESVNQLVADSLYRTESEVKELSSIIFTRTAGNPFFINEILTSLYRDELINFDFSIGKWEWNIESIRKSKVPSNVLDFMLNRIQKLDQQTQMILQLAACIGTEFDLKVLSIISEHTATEVMRLLWPAIERGIVIPISENYRIIEGQKDEEASDFEVKIRFAHDRIQKAAYFLFPLEQRMPAHLKIGWQLYSSLGEKKDVVEIVRHLNLGMDLLEQERQRTLVARLNLKVGKRALESAAFKSAMEYLKKGKQLLPKEPWKKEYALTVELLKEYIKCAYWVGEIEAAEKAAEQFLDNCENNLEKAHVYLIKTVSFGAQGKHKEAIEASFKGLKLLNYKINSHPNKFILLFKFLHLKWLSRNISISSMIDHVVDYDERNTLIKKLLQGLGNAAFSVGNKTVLIYELMKAMEFILTEGVSPYSSGTCSSVMIFFNSLGDYRSGYEWGKLGVKLNERYQDLEGYPKTIEQFIVQGLWRNEHWSKAIPLAKKVIQKGVRIGEKMYTGYAFSSVIDMDPYLSVQEAIKRWEKNYPLVKDYGTIDAHDSYVLLRQYLYNLDGRMVEGEYLNDDSFNGEDHLRRMEQRHSDFAKISYYYYKLRLCALYEEYETAKECERLSYESVKLLLTGLFNKFIMIFFFLITNISLFKRSINKKEKRQLWKRIKEDKKKIDKWANYNPDNFSHIKLFFDAEITSLSERASLDKVLYDQAIKAAKLSDYPFWIGIINEYAGKFYKSQGIDNLATFHLAEALNEYQQLGLNKKVELMQKRHGDLLK